jgi:hypothetical protein
LQFSQSVADEVKQELLDAINRLEAQDVVKDMNVFF